MENPFNRLSLPQRRAVACLGILVFLFFYVIFIIGLSGRIDGGRITSMLFYALAGTLWGLPIIPLISWSENYKKKKKK
jgi:hypothetical protein